jgi:type III secretion protein U
MSDDDKKHDPSQKRLDDARNKGQVPVSKDIGHLVTTLIVFELFFALEEKMRHSFLGIVDVLFQHIGRNDMSFWPLLLMQFQQLALFFIFVSVLFTGVAMLCGVVAVWMQIGFLIAPEAIEPKFDKFNPVNNLKGMFNKKALVGFVLNLIKIALVTYVTYNVIYDLLHAIVLMPTGSVTQSYEATLAICQSIVRKTMLFFIPLAFIDFAIQKYDHHQNLMMSDKEMMDEYKEMEGDPHVKGERKQFSHEIVFGEDPVQQSKSSDAIVVNPEHYAIALSYKPEKFPLPIILARGVDGDAKAMIKQAQALGIPVIRYVWLARTLYADGSSNHRIPKITLKSVALVYRLIQQMRIHQANFQEVQAVNDDLMYKNADELIKHNAGISQAAQTAAQKLPN